MKFVAVIRQVPDGESKLRIQGDRVDLSGATMILDQMDEYAVEEAIRLKERHGGEAVVVGFGPERTEEAIRTALAMGMENVPLPEPMSATIFPGLSCSFSMTSFTFTTRVGRSILSR